MGHANQRGGRQGRGEYRDAALLRTPRTPDRTAEDYRRLPRLPSRGGRAAAIHQTRSRNCCTWTPAARTAVTRLAGIVRRRGGWRPTERGGLCSAARQGAGVDQSRSVMQSRRQVAAQRVCSPQHITMIVLRLAPRTRRSLAHPVGDTWVCSTSWDAGDGWRVSELQLAANCSRRSAAWCLSTAHLMTPTVCMESSSCDRNCAPLNAPLSTSSAEAARQASRDHSRKRAGHETFRQSTATCGQSRLLISGFGVRVPGGAPAPRPRQTSQSAPRPLCFPRTTYAPLCRMSLLAESPATEPASVSELARRRSGALSSLDPIVTVRHLTSLVSLSRPLSLCLASR